MADKSNGLVGPDGLDQVADLDDATPTTGLGVGQLQWHALRRPVGLMAIAGLVTAMIIIFRPGGDDGFRSQILGLGLVVIAGLQLMRARSSRIARPVPDRVQDSESSRGPRSPASLELVGIGLVALAGVALIAAGDRSVPVIGRVIGGVLVGAGALRVLRGLRRTPTARQGTIASAVALLAGGLLIASFPGSLLSFVLEAGAVGWAVLSIVTIAVLVDPSSVAPSSQVGSMELIVRWLNDRHRGSEDREKLYAKLFFEGAVARARLVRFVLLMSFASVIASMGIITNSTAVVIGAMLVAPLMTPLMGMAVSLAMGWPTRLGRSSLIALLGIGLAIGIGLILGLLVSTPIDPSSNAQIISRASPTLLDLVTAVAAGAAGAYGLSREDVADSLPGVAIAISLVPPLAAVGISYSQGDFRSGTGALLLFATNMVAILVVGGLTFVLTGVVPLRRVAESQRRIGTAFSAVAVGGFVILGGLLLQGSEIARDGFEQDRVAAITSDWLGDGDIHQLVGAQVRGDEVEITISGPVDGYAPPEQLASDLSTALGRPIDIDIRVLIQERIMVSSQD